MAKAQIMRTKTVLWWVAGLVAVVAVMTAGAWSLSAATAFAAEPAQTDASAAAEQSAASTAASSSKSDNSATVEKTADDPADDLPGRYQLPLQAKAANPDSITPATFTISGKKFLSGRPLKAGEFTFVIREAGAYAVPGGSSLAKQLRSATVSDAEKFELVAHGGYDYYPNALQPVPDPSTVTNAADGTVAFPAITFSGKTLGETATARHGGVVFCYTVAEQAPRDADGKLLPGVTKDALGRYVYQGVTYDDVVKRIYIYAYEKVDADRHSSVALVPLGDATFDAPPVRSQSGIGAGFRNAFGGAFLDDYDGAVYLEGQPIARGEFNFEVHEVTEDGSLLSNQQVACEAGAGGEAGAEVPVIDDKVFDEPGRFFFAVSQSACAKTVEDQVQLDDTSYVVTVEVAKDGQNGLDAEVTYVRKKAADSDQWVDVDLAAKPSPLVWENKVAKDEPATPEAPGNTGSDKPVTGDKPATGDEPDAADKPGTGSDEKPGDAASGDQDGATDDGAGDAVAPTPGTDAADGADASDEGAKPEEGADSTTADNAAESAGEDKHPTSDDETIGTYDKEEPSQGTAAVDESADDQGGTQIEKAWRAIAQTGDPLIVGIAILIVGAIAAAIVLVIAKKRQK